MKRSLLSRLTPPLVISWVCAAAALFLFARLAEEIHGGETRPFDDAVRSFVHAHSSDVLTSIMRGFTILGSTPSVTLLATAACLALWFFGHWRRSILIAITAIGASLLTWVLKLSFHRARPQPFFDTKLPASFSFPSGHAFISFCLCGAAAALLTANQRSRPIRLAIWTIAMSIAFAIGYSRIYLGVHYPTDVLAGYLGATVWVLGVGIAYQSWRKAPPSESE
ncbi:MAG TPA: phosphatase PAP2 family protein [Terracidiphilus sp.]|nr:phosphatase PAP2 family protein [Terracidiphilus sp.]